MALYNVFSHKFRRQQFLFCRKGFEKHSLLMTEAGSVAI